MLSAAARARLTVVLVGARNPSNIGAAARAMQDFGFSDLRIVNDYAAPFEAAQLEAAQTEPPKSAVGAASVMQQARRFSSLPEAIADCTLIAGTTAIGDRDLQRTILTLQQSTSELLAHLQAPATKPGAPGLDSRTRETAAKLPTGAPNEHPPHTAGAPHLASEMRADPAPTPTGTPAPQPRVALLFGSEKTGLTNDQLSHCSLLLTIPLFAPEAARHLSMNLGQSVAVCLYELTREGLEGAKPLPALHEAPATAEDRERLTQLLLDVMHTTDYTRRFPANATEPLVRRLTQQLGTTHRESMTWMGILRQILWNSQKH